MEVLSIQSDDTLWKDATRGWNVAGTCTLGWHFNQATHQSHNQCTDDRRFRARRAAQCLAADHDVTPAAAGLALGVCLSYWPLRDPIKVLVSGRSTQILSLALRTASRRWPKSGSDAETTQLNHLITIARSLG